MNINITSLSVDDDMVLVFMMGPGTQSVVSTAAGTTTSNSSSSTTSYSSSGTNSSSASATSTSQSGRTEVPRPGTFAMPVFPPMAFGGQPFISVDPYLACHSRHFLARRTANMATQSNDVNQVLHICGI